MVLATTNRKTTKFRLNNGKISPHLISTKHKIEKKMLFDKREICRRFPSRVPMGLNHRCKTVAVPSGGNRIYGVLVFALAVRMIGGGHGEGERKFLRKSSSPLDHHLRIFSAFPILPILQARHRLLTNTVQSNINDFASRGFQVVVYNYTDILHRWYDFNTRTLGSTKRVIDTRLQAS